MTPEQQVIIDLIKSGGHETDAKKGRWKEIAESLDAPTIRIEDPSPVSSGDTLVALGFKKAFVVSKALGATPLGQSMIAKLNASGMRYWHTATKMILNEEVRSGRLTQDIVDTLTSLSVKTISEAEQAGIPSPKPKDLSDAWDAWILAQQWATLLNETIHPVEHSRKSLSDALRSASVSLLTEKID